MLNPSPADIESVTGAILAEILGVMGLAGRRWAQISIGALFRPPARRLADFLVCLDQDIAGLGLSAAARLLLDRFVQEIEISGAENIPFDGPLLVVSNHPGANDLLVLVSSLARDDLKIISSDISILRCLPSVAPHFIPITADPYRRMIALRAGLRHILAGHALLIFPRGEVEPDPAFSPDAARGLPLWSPSLELLLRKASQADALVAIVSGVFSPRWFHHPIPRLWKKIEQRQKVAEIFQIAESLVRSKKSPHIPRVSFSPPLVITAPGAVNAPAGHILHALTESARVQLAARAGPPTWQTDPAKA